MAPGASPRPPLSRQCWFSPMRLQVGVCLPPAPGPGVLATAGCGVQGRDVLALQGVGERGALLSLGLAVALVWTPEQMGQECLNGTQGVHPQARACL